MRSRFTSLLKLFIGWPLSALAIFFIVRLIAPRIQSLSQNISHIDMRSIGISFVFFLLYFLTRSFLWQVILRAKGHYLPLKDVAPLWSLAELKRFVPGSIWTFVSKTDSFSRYRIDKKTIVSAMIIEAQSLVAASAFFGLFSFPFIENAVLPLGPYTRLLLSLLTIIIIAGVIFYIANKPLLQPFNAKPFRFIKHTIPYFSINKTLLLFLISLAFMTFYSIGTYFVVASITPLPKIATYALVPYFAFSLLIGYLAVLPPMGLGVREGVITLGLVKFMDLGVAGFASLCARLILILSELIFLAGVLLWKYGIPLERKHKKA